MRRTHRCGTLRPEHVGQTVCVMGWVHSRRDHGGVIFLDLRDRTGLIQVVADPGRGGEAAHAVADQVRSEYVVAAVGRVVERAPELVNPRLATGEVEVVAESLTVLNTALHPPFEIDDEEVKGEQRLRYRYIDLRRPVMQRNLELRSRAAQAARTWLTEHDFLEIETPLLLRATPEGARDFVVPCRLVPGEFYVLPQSPQLMKQTLMASGFDRYFQLARCLRDEDLRADRQPEHTQIDLEMAFVEQDEVLETIEGLMAAIWRVIGVELPRPFPRLTYEEALARYGSDKPDTRFALELVDLSETVREVEFRVFRDALAAGGQVKAIRVPAEGRLSRKDLDELIEFAQRHGAKGMAWIAVEPEGLRSSILKFIPEAIQQAIAARLEARPGDMLLFVADRPAIAANVLGRLRLEVARRLDLIDRSRWNFLWVVDFPLFEKNPETGAIEPMHHPFSMPRPGHVELLDSDPLAVKAQLYDLVVNGQELCSGSIRIHIPEIQLKVLETIGISREEARERFGFLLEVFSYGAPPHGGVGLGFDRICSLLIGQDHENLDIREVIAFPKTSTGRDLMLGCPSRIDPAQLAEAGILKVVEPEVEGEG